MSLQRNLQLVSPLMHGDDVRYAQQSLKKNVFKTDFLQSDVNQKYDETTFRASKRAKFWLGYPTSKVEGDYGEVLDLYLHGKKKLPYGYKLRRATRIRAKKSTPLRVKAFRSLSTHIGDVEKPRGSNIISWASVWYGVIGAWCAMAVTRSYVDAGSKVFKRGVRYAYVPFIVHDARQGINGLSVTHHPEQGDLFCADWDNDGEADHMGEFDHWVLKGHTFATVEGNTSFNSGGSQSNGGACARRVRSVSDVQVFIHVSR